MCKKLELRGIDPRTFRMQSGRSTTELQPHIYIINFTTENVHVNFVKRLHEHTDMLILITLRYCSICRRLILCSNIDTIYVVRSDLNYLIYLSFSLI